MDVIYKRVYTMAEKSNKKFMLLSAVGILMVIDAHSWGAISLFGSFMPPNSFFMPLFVFIAGYFNKVDAETKLFDYVKHKAKRLFIPYIYVSLIVLIFEVVIRLVRDEGLNYSAKQIGMALKRFFTDGYIVDLSFPMWFVPALFVTEFVYASMKHYISRIFRWNSYFAMIVFSLINIGIVFASKAVKGSGVPDGLLLLFKCLFFMVFIELGVLYKNVLEEKLKRVNQLALIMLLLLINMIRTMIMPQAYDIAFNGLATMSGFTSPYAVTPLISSIIGILFWITVIDLIGNPLYNNAIMNYISDNTF